MNSLRKHVQDRGVKKPLDYDPEDDIFQHSDDSESDGSGEESLVGAREHYENVGKSRLRKTDAPELDEKYGAVAVRRNVLSNEDDHDPLAPAEDDDDDDDDPFARKLNDNQESEDKNDEGEELSDIKHGHVASDAEIDSDEAFGGGDTEKLLKFSFRDSKSVQLSGIDDINDSEVTDESDMDDKEMLSSTWSHTSMDDDEEEEEDEVEHDEEDPADEEVSHESEESKVESTDGQPQTDRQRLAAMQRNEAAAVASTLSASAASDAQKGTAVKQQYHIFGRLLDSRMKLQKALSIANELSLVENSATEGDNAVQKAQEAALALLNTITFVRQAIISTQKSSSSNGIPKKRKLSTTFTTEDSSDDIWTKLQGQERGAWPSRRATLDKWSYKTRSNIAAPQSKLLSASQQAANNRLTSVLDVYLSTEHKKLVEASISSSKTREKKCPNYDDSAFYQTLLRDLIASRAAQSNPGARNTDFLIPQVSTKLHISGSRNKKVDTKASKGRKIRYTVHEKLENYMASEDRNTWEDAARNEFFGSLFGQSMALNEDEVDANDQEDDNAGAQNGNAMEYDALKLFRS